jgi:ATP-dependent exoDNAse (exonuclease V) alpha subunit
LGRSAIAAAAYRSGSKIVDRRTGQTFDYERKSGVMSSAIVTPSGIIVPAWMSDRSELWNRLEEAHSRKNARLATELTIGLPAQLDEDQRQALAQEFAQLLADRYRVAVDFNLHAPDPQGDQRNFHVHLMLTARQVGPNGFGDRYAFAYSNSQRKALGLAPLNLEFKAIRADWANIANLHLARAGLETRIDPRSFRERGIEIEPTQHLGPQITAMARLQRETFVPALSLAAEHHNANLIRQQPKQLLQILTTHEAVFTRQDIARAVLRYVGTHPDYGAALEAVMNCPELVQLQGEIRRNAKGESIETFDSRQMDGDGRSVEEAGRAVTDRSPLVEEARFSTKTMVELEAGMAEQASQLSGLAQAGPPSRVAARFVTPPDPADPLMPFRQAIEREMQGGGGQTLALTEEQRTALVHVTQPNRLATVLGVAGAGKSTMLDVARRAWEAAGYQVHGAALAATAAEGLRQSSGIQSRTIASLLYGWRSRDDWAAKTLVQQAEIMARWSGLTTAERLGAKERPPPRDLVNLGPRTVLVVDEAGMVDSRTMAEVVAEVHKSGAKLVLVGDPEQLPAIGAGASFRAILERVGAAEIGSVIRQTEKWQRQATVELSKGRIAEAVEAYALHDRLLFGTTLREARERLIADYLRDVVESPHATRLALAYRKVDIEALNAGIRKGRQAMGQLGPDASFQTKRGARLFGAGDRVLFLENDQLASPSSIDANGRPSRIRVQNNYRGTVLGASDGRLIVQLDDGHASGAVVIVDQAQYANIDYGYAVTIHKAQGATVDRSFVLALGLDRSLAYVALSRHRESARLYASHEETQDLDALKIHIGRYRFKQSTLDYVRSFASPGRAAHAAWILEESRRRSDQYARARSAVAETETWEKTKASYSTKSASELAELAAILKPVPLKPSDLENHPDVMASNASVASVTQQHSDITRAYAEAIRLTRSKDGAVAAQARRRVAALQIDKTTAEVDLIRAEQRRDNVKAEIQRNLEREHSLRHRRYNYAMAALDRALRRQVVREAESERQGRRFRDMSAHAIAKEARDLRSTLGEPGLGEAILQIRYEKLMANLDRAIAREERQKTIAAKAALRELRSKESSEIAATIRRRMPTIPDHDSVAADPHVRAASLALVEARRVAGEQPSAEAEAAMRLAKETYDGVFEEAHARQYTASRLQEVEWRTAVATLDHAIAREHRSEVRMIARADLRRQRLADWRFALTEDQRANAYRILDGYKQAWMAWKVAHGTIRNQLHDRLRHQADRIVSDPSARRVALQEKLLDGAIYHSSAQAAAEARAVAGKRNRLLGLEAGRDALAPLPLSPFNYVAGQKGIIPSQPLDEAEARRHLNAQVSTFAHTLEQFRATLAPGDRATSADMARRRDLCASLVRQADGLSSTLLGQAVARDRGLETALLRFSSAARALERYRIKQRRDELLAGDRSAIERQPSLAEEQAARAILSAFTDALAARNEMRQREPRPGALRRVFESNTPHISDRPKDPAPETSKNYRSSLQERADAVLSNPVAVRLAIESKIAELALRYSSGGAAVVSHEVLRRRTELLKQVQVRTQDRDRTSVRPDQMRSAASILDAGTAAEHQPRNRVERFNRAMDRLNSAEANCTEVSRSMAENAVIRLSLALPDKIPAGVDPIHVESYGRYRQYARGLATARAALTSELRAEIDKDPITALVRLARRRPSGTSTHERRRLERAAAFGSAIEQGNADKLDGKHFKTRADALAKARQLDEGANPQRPRSPGRRLDQGFER